MLFWRRGILMFVVFAFIARQACGQGILFHEPDIDTGYVKDFYTGNLILRGYESTKYNNFKFIDGNRRLVYKPNNHNNLGIGFNYRFISLNFGFYAPFISKSISRYGSSHTLDAQTHIYLHKFIIDFYGQFYNGYYVTDASNLPENHHGNNLPQRPDMHTRDLSLGFEYIFNDKEFSYNAAFYQNERQRKSAGSVIIGAAVYHTDVRADSALIPYEAANITFFNDNRMFNKTSNTGIGVNGGYAYNWVFAKYFFLMVSANCGLGINHAILDNTNSRDMQERFGPGYNVTTRAAFGYNSDKYFAGITYIRLITEDNLVAPHTWQEVNTGNFRFTFARRLSLRENKG